MKKVIHKLKPVIVNCSTRGMAHKHRWNWSACGLGELYTENGQSNYRWKNVTCKKCLRKRTKQI